MKSLLSFSLILLLGISPVRLPIKSPVNEIEAQRVIHWQEIRKLKWKDFKGKALRNSEYSAMTHSVISYNYEVKFFNHHPEITFQVNCFFEPKLSWVKKHHETRALLEHEQLHFDISELYARKLRQQLLIYLETFNAESDYQKESEIIFNLVLEEWSQVQDQYDRETQHGQAPKVQKRWAQKIENGLKASRRFQKGKIALNNAFQSK